ncbi:MAG TPA: hypothetical protein PK736_07450 [Bacteroidia bacterium]|nr:hypothetical protein [Bacteroidia bacterium]
MQAFLFLLTAAAFFGLIFKQAFFKLNNISIKLLSILFGVKIIFIFVHHYLFYKYGVNPDTYAMLRDAQSIWNFIFDDFKLALDIFFGIYDSHQQPIEVTNLEVWNNYDTMYNDTRTLIRANVLLFVFTQGYYLVQCLWYSFFSFAGSIALYKTIAGVCAINDANKSKIIFAACCAWPSFLFWTSACFKETFLVAVAGFFIFSCYQYYQSRSFTKGIIALILLLLLFTIKIYYALLLIPVLLVFILLINARTIKMGQLLSIFVLGFVIFCFINYFVFDVVTFMYNKRINFENMARDSHAVSLIKAPQFEPDIFSFLIHAPQALFNIICMPLKFSTPVFGLLSLENIFLLATIIFLILNFKWNKSYAMLSICILCFAILSLLIIGYTTPVLGAMVRYKAPFIPFVLMFFALHFSSTKKAE